MNPFLLLLLTTFVSGIVAERISQSLKPGDYSATVPASPVQFSQTTTCRLDLSDELFGGVSAACSHTLDRSRCCPVLAAWLFAAHARSALQISSSSSTSSSQQNELPLMPDDSQSCVDSLQSSLIERNIEIPQPNGSCDPVVCFCGIRLHQITSLRCPAVFEVRAPYRKATPTADVRNLEKSCRNASHSGCNKCLGALHKLKADNNENRTHTASSTDDERERRMFDIDCQLMGLTWLLNRNKTAYIPTVSAVLRAILYSPHHNNTCTADQENMPLAVDSLQFSNTASHFLPSFPVLPLAVAVYYTLFKVWR